MVQDIVHCWTIGCACIDEGQGGAEREEEGHGENVEAHPDDDHEGKEKQ